jgi:hypothetical protein
VGAELGQPRGVRDVGLSARQILHVSRVHEHHLEGTLVEQVVAGLPVVAGRLHHDEGHRFSDEELAQREDRVGRGAPGRDFRLRSGLVGLLDAHADLDVSFRDVKTGATVVDDVHDASLLSYPIRRGRRKSEV